MAFDNPRVNILTRNYYLCPASSFVLLKAEKRRRTYLKDVFLTYSSASKFSQDLWKKEKRNEMSTLYVCYRYTCF